MATAVLNTLQGTNWVVTYETSGSKQLLVLSNGPTGNIGPQPIIWSEQWTGNNCALWVIFPQKVGQGVVRLLGIQISVNIAGGKISSGTGTGASVYGNNNPQDKSDTGFTGETLDLTFQAPTN